MGAGITLHEALAAADMLAQDGVYARVIDLYSVKPVDVDGLRAAAEATGGRIVTVEDHWPEGGIGEAVLSAFADTEGAHAWCSWRCARCRRRGSGRASGRHASTHSTSQRQRAGSSVRQCA